MVKLVCYVKKYIWNHIYRAKILECKVVSDCFSRFLKENDYFLTSTIINTMFESPYFSGDNDSVTKN